MRVDSFQPSYERFWTEMSRYTLFKGVGTALVTPFDDSGHIDFDALGKLIDRQIDGGADALIMTGTTGEAPVLSADEKKEMWRFARARIDGGKRKIKLIAGSGGNNTETAAALSHEAELAGADGLLIVTPYYNKSSQAGLCEHYRRIAGATSLPIIVYTVPSRTGVNITPAAWRELAAIPNVIGVKDATGDLRHTARLAASLGDETHPDALAIYSGDDELTLPVLSYGGCGVISVVSNIIPGDMHELCRLFFEGKNDAALRLWRRINDLTAAMFCEVNPIPVKAALSEMGLCKPYLRLPLIPLAEEKKNSVRNALRAAGVL